MGRILEFAPQDGPKVDLKEAYEALLEAGSLMEFAMGAFPSDSVDYVALAKTTKVISAILDGLEAAEAMREAGLEPPDRTYRGDGGEE